MKIERYLLVAGVGLFVGVLLTLRFGHVLELPGKDAPARVKLSQSDVMTSLRDTLSLAVIDVGVSQVHELSRDSAKLFDRIDLPFTAQKLVVLTEGRVQMGVDMENARFTIFPKEGGGLQVRIDMPPVGILSMDLKHRHLAEEDSSLSPISTEDRNLLFERIRRDVRASLSVDQKHRERVRRRLKALAKNVSLFSEGRMDVVLEFPDAHQEKKKEGQKG